MEKANKGGIPPLSDKALGKLQQKHSKASEGAADILLKETPHEVQPVIYESI